MTAGFNGFSFTYLVMPRSNKVVVLKPTNNMKAPYSGKDKDLPNTVKSNGGAIARMFGCDEAKDVPFFMDQSSLDSVTQNPEYMFLQALQCDGFYVNNENCFTTRFYIDNYNQKAYDNCV